MAAGDTTLGTGTTLTLAGLTGELLSLSASGIERATVSKAHMGTSGAKPFLLGDHYDPGDLTAEMHFKADLNIDTIMTSAEDTITIVLTGLDSPTDDVTKVLQGGVTSFGWDAPLEDVMTATVGLKVTSGSP